MIAGSLKPKTPAQWIKLALIPVLGIGLLVALWQQPKPADEPAATAPTETPAVTTAAETPAAPTSLKKSAWPKARLEEVLAFNPFEAQHTVELAEGAEADAVGAESISTVARPGDKSRPRLVATGKLQAIFVDAQGAAAIFDSQVIHVGDALPSGGRVVEITSDGIMLEGR
ncbi:MAG: hypothetical protein ACTHK7_10795 [Aureliella sp.]